MNTNGVLRSSRLLINRIISQPWLVGLGDAGWVKQSCMLHNEISTNSIQTLAKGSFSSLSSIRHFHPGPFPSASIQVQVPPLGESITDGSIASILKQPGDSVEEDEPIVQIETDKVTVDVRSPTAGTIESILVKEEQNVTIGHVIASIVAGAPAAKAEGRPPQSSPQSSPQSPPPQSSPQSSPPQQSSPPSPPLSSTPSESHIPSSHQATGRMPSISFPPRRTSLGDIISMLPVDQIQSALSTLGYSSTSTSTSTPSLVSPTPVSTQFYRPRAPRSGPPPPSRQELTDREMETVMLGGAE